MKASIYQRPDKPTTLTVRKRNGAPERALPALPEVLTVDRATECHVTPEHVADMMVDALEATQDQLVLEPQVGTGNLVQALLDGAHSPFEITMVERSVELCRCVRKRFSTTSLPYPINECFLEYAQRAKNEIAFSRVLMNPPFRQVKKHISAGLDLLDYAGHSNAILVALVPITYGHEEAELVETLPSDTFALAKVNTKIIRIVR